MRTRLANPDDIPALRELIALSVRTLQAGDYSEAQREGALGSVFGVDSQLIADGTYFVIEDLAEAERPRIVACGGWSRRRTLFGGDHAAKRQDTLLDPATDRAKIRAFFVHPDYARRGLGTTILDLCEQAAMHAGFKGFEMGATLTGQRLYAARGYTEAGRIEVSLANGTGLSIIRMIKSLPGDYR